jgi:integral membrane sensor domain MASE1
MTSDEEAELSPYPWKSLQPWSAIFGIVGCVIVVVVAGGSPLWPGWTGNASVSFVAAYLPVSDTSVKRSAISDSTNKKQVLVIGTLLLGLKLKNNSYGRRLSDWFPVDLMSSWTNDCKPQLERLTENRARRLQHG